MIYEFCAENVTLLEKAMQAGARRIELCDNLSSWWNNTKLWSDQGSG